MWRFCCFYNENQNKILSHLHVISKSLDDLSKNYDTVILLGDLNIELEVKNHVKSPKHLRFKKYYQKSDMSEKAR